MRARKLFQRMQRFESRTGTMLFFIRIGLAAYLVWHGFDLLSSQLALGIASMGLGAVLALGLASRVVALLVLILLIVEFSVFGHVNPATTLAVLVSIGLIIGPNR